MACDFPGGTWAGLTVCKGTCGGCLRSSKKVDVRLPGKGHSNSPGAKPIHPIITMITWVKTSRLSMKNSRSIRSGGG